MIKLILKVLAIWVLLFLFTTCYSKFDYVPELREEFDMVIPLHCDCKLSFICVRSNRVYYVEGSSVVNSKRTIVYDLGLVVK